MWLRYLYGQSQWGHQWWSVGWQMWLSDSSGRHDFWVTQVRGSSRVLNWCIQSLHAVTGPKYIHHPCRSLPGTQLTQKQYCRSRPNPQDQGDEPADKVSPPQSSIQVARLIGNLATWALQLHHLCYIPEPKGVKESPNGVSATFWVTQATGKPLPNWYI